MQSSSLLRILAEEGVELGVAHGAGQAVEFAGCSDVARRPGHRGPGDPCEPAPDHPANDLTALGVSRPILGRTHAGVGWNAAGRAPRDIGGTSLLHHPAGTT